MPKKTNAIKTLDVDCVAALSGNSITAPTVTSSCFNAGHGVITGTLLTATTGKYTYSWQSSADGVVFSDMGVPYSEINPNNAVGVTYYRRVVTYSGCVAPNISNTVKITIYPPLDNIFLTPPPVVAFCGPVAKPGTIIGSDPKGGDGNYQYQWYNFNHNSSTPIIGATDRDLVIDTITESKFYYRQVTSGGCSGGGVALQITLTPYTPIDSNTISQPVPDAPFCAASADPAQITGTKPVGASNSFTYQWQSSINGTDFTDITDAPSQAKDLDPATITQTTYYRRMAIPVKVTVCDGPQPSNVIKITVAPPAADNVITAPAITSFCGAANTSSIQGNAAGAGYLYQWQSSADGIDFSDIAGQTDQDLAPQTTSITVYYRRGSRSGACTVYQPSDVVKITVIPNLPIAGNTIAQLTPDGVLCPPGGDPSLITGSMPTGGIGNFSYRWQSSTDNVNFTDLPVPNSAQSYDPAPINVTTYYRRVVNSLGTGDCVAPSISDPVVVNIADTHITYNTIVQPVPDGKFCGSTATPKAMTGSRPGAGIYNYQWQSSADKINFTDIAGAQSIDLNAPSAIFATTYYRRVVTSGVNCAPPVYSNVITIELNAVTNILTDPAVNVFCGPGDPAVITGTSGNNYSYRWQSSTDGQTFNAITGATSASYDPPTLNVTTYFRRIVTATTCDVPSISDAIAITIITNTSGNSITAPAIAVFCADNGAASPDAITGNAPSITGGANYSYQWQTSTDAVNFADINGAISKDLTPSPLAVTTYFRRVLSIAGCVTPTVSNVVVITIYQPITNNVITAPAVVNFCDTGDAAQIKGSTPDGGSNAYIYRWESSTDGTNFSTIADPQEAAEIDHDPPVSNTTIYYRRVVASYSCNTPSISNMVTITVNAITDNTITAPAVVNFCGIGDAAAMTGSTGGSSSYAYQWQTSTDGIAFYDITGTTSDAANVNYDPPATTVISYYRRKVTLVECGDLTYSNVIKVTVDPMPAVSADTTICYGANTILTASGGTSYQWSPADGLSSTNIAQPIASPLINTIYQVIVTNSSCTVPLSVAVNVVPKPTANAGADKAILIGDNIQLNGKVTGGDGVSYSWSPATYLDDPTSLTPVSTPLKDITYILTATSPNGCFIVSDDVTIKAYNKVVPPNTFTPNNDGINDTWEIAALSSYRKSVLSIYTRTGTLIFKSVGYTKPWDGTYNGTPLPFGTYYYIIDLNNTLDLNDGPKTLSGYVTIIK